MHPLGTLIYRDALSFVKGTFGSENIEYKKTFAETLGSFVNVLGCDCYASCLDILVDLVCKQYFSVEVVQIFCRVANWLEEIAKASFIVFQANRLIFGEFSIVTLCIEFLFVDDLRRLSFSSVNKSHFNGLLLQVEKRGRTTFIGHFSFV